MESNVAQGASSSRILPNLLTSPISEAYLPVSLGVSGYVQGPGPVVPRRSLCSPLVVEGDSRKVVFDDSKSFSQGRQFSYPGLYAAQNSGIVMKSQG